MLVLWRSVLQTWMLPSWMPKLRKVAGLTNCIRKSNIKWLCSLSVFENVFHLGVSWCAKKVKKKKPYNTEYLRKEIHVTLTTSTSCQIMSINGHLWALLIRSLFLFPFCLFCHAVRSAQWRFHSFGSTLVPLPHNFFVNIIWSQMFLQPILSFLSSKSKTGVCCWR